MNVCTHIKIFWELHFPFFMFSHLFNVFSLAEQSRVICSIVALHVRFRFCCHYFTLNSNHLKSYSVQSFGLYLWSFLRTDLGFDLAMVKWIDGAHFRRCESYEAKHLSHIYRWNRWRNSVQFISYHVQRCKYARCRYVYSFTLSHTCVISQKITKSKYVSTFAFCVRFVLNKICIDRSSWYFLWIDFFGNSKTEKQRFSHISIKLLSGLTKVETDMWQTTFYDVEDEVQF